MTGNNKLLWRNKKRRNNLHTSNNRNKQLPKTNNKPAQPRSIQRNIRRRKRNRRPSQNSNRKRHKRSIPIGHNSNRPTNLPKIRERNTAILQSRQILQQHRQRMDIQLPKHNRHNNSHEQHKHKPIHLGRTVAHKHPDTTIRARAGEPDKVTKPTNAR